MSQEQVRQRIFDRLRVDLVGPIEVTELIHDRPSDRYMTGMLHPQLTDVGAEQGDSIEGTASGDDDSEDAETDVGVPLVSTLKPSSAGLSFAVASDKAHPTLLVRIRCGTYARVGSGDEKERAPYQRAGHDLVLPITLEKSRDEIAVSSALPGLRLHIQTAPLRGQGLLVTTALVNRNERGKTRDESEALTFFQVEMEVRADAGSRLLPRPSTRAIVDADDRASALIYRDASEQAAGHTCAADWETESSGDVVIRTTWLPHATVSAVSDEGDREFKRLSGEGPKRPLSAAWLASASKEELDSSLGLLVDCYEEWIAARERDAARLSEAAQRAQAETNLAACRTGARRMRDGVLLIKNDAVVRQAFQLSQEAMELQRGWTYKQTLNWRPFQLGFQLLTLASLADRASPERDVMDLLWFPTGGGKTEAYLALTAFVLFLRRLKGTTDDPGAGVAVIMRYTLRLLTIQQFQRAAAMISACEHLRRLGASKARVLPDMGTVPFSIGLWVGNTATPGTLKDARGGTSGGTHKQLLHCPCCQADVGYKLTKEMVAECPAKTGCDLAAVNPRLPIWTIDEEIFRERPSLVIGTVDKFAQIVRKAETSTLFGLTDGVSPPDLIVQDELHLISGPLGSMTGLYETAIDALCSAKGHAPKILGSTATIRRAEDQIRKLFDRRTYQFPAPGLDATNSGFAVSTTAKPGRLYVGISTAGRSAKYAVQAVSAALLQAAVLPGATDAERDPYWTLVAYFNTLRELGGSLVLMQDDVPIGMEQFASRHAGEAVRPLSAPDELTSRVKSDEIRDMLERLKQTAGNGALDVVLASNMISVGVDIPRLGVMMMVGQPKTIAEYIQATSRVGRGNVPGIVVCLYNSGRARDRSFFETFKTWHQTLYREVEATSVTPFAPRAQDKALHAVVVALVRHLIASMQRSPVLTPAARTEAERLVQIIEARVARVEPDELPGVRAKLKGLLDAWSERAMMREYWSDDHRVPGLMMSAEQYAAMKGSDDAGDWVGSAWPTPNSMREVEPGTPFVFVSRLRSEGTNGT